MESEFLDWLRTAIAPHRRIATGIGDDGAVFAGPELGEQVVAAVDMLVEGVHFHFDARQAGVATPESVGRKALAVNLSDMAAMAAEPIAALVAVAANSARDEHRLTDIYRGLLELSQEFDTPIIGGDTNSTEGPLTISVTVLGRTAAPWLRSGARPGDQLWVTGQLGGSILGHHLTFSPRLEESRWLQQHATVHAAIDLSDGLSLDLHRVLVASRCGAILEATQIPISPAAEQRAQQTGNTPLEHALNDGEDFELLLVVEPRQAEQLLEDWPFATRLSRIGYVDGEVANLRLQWDGQLHALMPGGYVHQ